MAAVGLIEYIYINIYGCIDESCTASPGQIEYSVSAAANGQLHFPERLQASHYVLKNAGMCRAAATTGRNWACPSKLHLQARAGMPQSSGTWAISSCSNGRGATAAHEMSSRALVLPLRNIWIYRNAPDKSCPWDN